METEQAGDAPEVIQEEIQEVQPSVEELQKQIEGLQTSKSEAEQRYKEMQVAHQKAVEEGRIGQSVQTQIERIESELLNSKRMNALLIDEVRGKQTAEGYDAYNQTPQQRESAVAKLEAEIAENEKKAQQQREFSMEVELFNAEARAEGLTAEDIQSIQNIASTPREGRAKIKEFAEKRKSAIKAEEEKRMQAEEEQAKAKAEEAELSKKRQEAESKGELEQPVGIVAGASGLPKLKKGDINRIISEAKSPQDIINATKGRDFDW